LTWSSSFEKMETRLIEFTCFRVKGRLTSTKSIVIAAKMKTGKIVHVVSLAVRPAFRNKKVAKRILSVVHDYFAKNNIEYFFLEVKDTNEAAINLYKSLGYEIFE